MRKSDSNRYSEYCDSILHKVTSECFERKNIDPPMIAAFNNFIFNFADAFTKNNQRVATLEHLKLAVELINIFEANLSQDYGRHTCSINDVASFFTNLIVLAQKIEVAWKDAQKFIYSQVIEIFSFMGDHKPEQSKLPPLDKKMQILSSVIQSNQFHVVDRGSVQFLIKWSFSFVSHAVGNKDQLRNMFICFIKYPNINEHFRPFIIRYLNQCVVSNHVANFKKAINILQHFGLSLQERRGNMQLQALKLLDSNNSLPFLIQINQLFSFAKLFSSPYTLKVVVKIIDRIIEKPHTTQIPKMLQEISQLDISASAADKLEVKFQTVLLKVVDWIITFCLKREREQAESKPQQKEDKLIQFVKKLSNKPERQERPQMDQQLRVICNSFSKIFKKLANAPKFSAELATLTLDSFSYLRNNEIKGDIFRQFVIDIISHILPQLDLSFKYKSAMVYAVVVRRVEIQSQKFPQDINKVIDRFYRQSYFQMMHGQSLNYHFMVFFIFLKYMAEKDQVIEMVLAELMNDLHKAINNKSNRNLILNMAFLLKILYPDSNFLPIKFKTRQVMKNVDNLSHKLDISQILAVCSKEICISKANLGVHRQKCKQLYKLLNQQLNNYTKDNAGIFYSLVIGVSDMIEKQKIQGLEGTSYLLLEIKFIRKVTFLNELFTLTRSFIEKAKQWEEQGLLSVKKISGFLIMCKIISEAKNKPLEPVQDLEGLFESLKHYLVAINLDIGHKLLVIIYHYKTNTTLYREQKFSQYLASKDFIRFYSEASQNQNQAHVLLMKCGLRLLRKIMETQKIAFSTLEDDVKTLFMIYLFEESPPEFAFTDKHDTQLKQYVLMLLLNQKINLKEDITKMLERLQVGVVKEITLQKHGKSLIEYFKSNNPLNIVNLCSKAILRMFSSYERQDALFFRFVVSLVEEDKKNHCSCLAANIQKSVRAQLQTLLVPSIFKRVNIGLELQESKKAQFLHDSLQLYRLVGTTLDNLELQTLVQEIVQIDYYSDCEISAFLLKEISNIFSFKSQKKASVCETVFNYIITLTQVFPGKQKLEIANFICNFFGLQSSNKQGNFQGLDKSVVLQCNTQFNYKCLKCDDKRLLCLACSINCHKDHPVCFLSIPSEIKIARCQCRQIPGCCIFSKDVNGQNRPNKIKAQFPQLNHYSPSYLVGASRSNDFFERIKYPGRPNPDEPSQFNSRFDYNQLLQEEEYDRMDRMEQELLAGGNRFYDNAPRIGSRVERLFDRDEFNSQGYRDRNPFLYEKEKPNPAQDQSNNVVEPEFVDEVYEKILVKRQALTQMETEENTQILKKYTLLPKFIELMKSFCQKKATKDKQVTNVQLWSPNFNNPVIQKIMQVSFRVLNAGSFHLDVRRQNPLNNVSCVLIKRNLAFNNRFLIIASGTDFLAFSKEKVLLLASEGKVQGFNQIHRHSMSFQIHSVEFSPVDKNLFCASGLHNLALFTMSNEGGIGRTQNRYNVNNLYINKIKLAKMGIFVGVDKEIRVLNYSCKHTLTVKAVQANTLIRQWAIYEKAAGCQLYFVCPNGNIFFADILSSDQGKKEFTGRINDQRKSKNSTGASVFVKDLPDIGKQLFASFKDGSNIMGRIQGDQMQNMTDIRLKGLKVDKSIFDGFFICGHIDIVKLPIIDEVFVVCTVKKYFPPEMSFHQGYLTVVRIRKDGTSELQILNDQSTCQTFQVVYIGTKHFFILSLHSDGSLHLNSPTKIPRNVVEQQIKKSKQSQQNVGGGQNEVQPLPLQKIRKSIEQQLKFEQVQSKNVSSSYLFRQNTQNLKLSLQYTISKLSENQYELKQINFSKIITGFCVPHFGDVSLPTRTLSKVFEVGFTNSEALYFYAQGGFRFKYIRSESQKFTRETISLNNNRMLQKIERIQRLHEYSEQQRMLNANMITNFLNIKEDPNQDIVFVGRSFENFKNKISKFDQMFTFDADEENSSIEKTALIIKMFLTQSLKEGHACDSDAILELVNGIKLIVPDSKNKLFKILKEIIVVSMKVYEKHSGKSLDVYADQNYGLKAATQSRVQYFYNLLKLDIGDQDLNEFLDLLNDIINEDLNLFSFYCAKYPGIITQIHRRLKRPDTQARAQSIIKIYALAYPVLDYCKIQCTWILTAITQMVYFFIKSKEVRDNLYEAGRLSKYVRFEPCLKSLGNKDSQAQDLQLLKNVSQGIREQQAPKDPVTEIYMMFSRGQIDQDAMFRMIQDATKVLYEKDQEINEKPNQMQVMQEEQQRQMQQDVEEVQDNITLVFDLIDQCTDGFERDLQTNLARIVTLYVVSKLVDQHYQELTDNILDRIFKMVTQIDLDCQGQKLVSVLSYSCLFNRIMTTSKTLKPERLKNHISYRNIELQTNKRLSKVQLQKVKKISHPLNLLPRIFRGEKPTPSAHIAYALTNLLIYPCEPTHVLLSLECYWLLPNSKESYSRQKCQSSIRDGINSGNLMRVYEIARQNAQIWQQSGEYLEFIEKWIEEKKPNWQLALQLLAIYYQN